MHWQGNGTDHMKYPFIGYAILIKVNKIHQLFIETRVCTKCKYGLTSCKLLLRVLQTICGVKSTSHIYLVNYYVHHYLVYSHYQCVYVSEAMVLVITRFSYKGSCPNKTYGNEPAFAIQVVIQWIWYSFASSVLPHKSSLQGVWTI